MKTRRNIVIETLESRQTPSGLLTPGAALAGAAIIRGIEDPNVSRPLSTSATNVATIRAFNPQPGPPTRAAIIAI